MINNENLDDRVIHINRCSKVVKGGRNFSFSALVVVGNYNGIVGIGYGKASEVADAIRKASDIARKSLIEIPMENKTITHSVNINFGGGKIMMKPASPGTGLIAGGAMRSVLYLGGIKDILTKAFGSNNPINIVRATIKAIGLLHPKSFFLKKRGLNIK